MSNEPNTVEEQRSPIDDEGRIVDDQLTREVVAIVKQREPVMLAPGEESPRTPEPKPDYNPSRGVIDLGRGKGQYLQAEDRILWFRNDYPNGQITQTMVEFDREAGFAMFKTSIFTGEGGIAEGYGSEDKADFRDYIEKAATKSLGRALAALGYGTKGALAEGEVADTPFRAPDIGSQGRNARPDSSPYVERGQGQQQNTQQRQIRDPESPASDAQLKMIYALARESGLEAPDMIAWITEVSNNRVNTSKALNKGEAGKLITKMQERKQTRQ